jgi:hypothetical protein
MMTRTDVARKLRKSVATVRRWEGVELHPTVDANGVHLFDEAEVEALAKRLYGGSSNSGSEPPRSYPMSPWLKGELRLRAEEDAEEREHAARLALQEAELETFRRQREEEQERVRRTHEHEEQARLARAAARVEAVRRDVERELAGASRRELRRIARDPGLMDDLERILGEE